MTRIASPVTQHIPAMNKFECSTCTSINITLFVAFFSLVSSVNSIFFLCTAVCTLWASKWEQSSCANVVLCSSVVRIFNATAYWLHSSPSLPILQLQCSAFYCKYWNCSDIAVFFSNPFAKPYSLTFRATIVRVNWVATQIAANCICVQ